jgi:hypothetical protein
MSDSYDKEKWIYVPDYYTDYRFILGTRGEKPLITVGINPSTATPLALDNTLKSVERIALNNGFDSFIMFNVYPQRATNPDDMHSEMDKDLHEQNMKAFKNLLKGIKGTPIAWAAWGTIINKRAYLKTCLRDMVDIAIAYDVSWKKAGKISKEGHPHHPLYLKKDSELEDFDVKNYANICLQEQTNVL